MVLKPVNDNIVSDLSDVKHTWIDGLKFCDKRGLQVVDVPKCQSLSPHG